MAKKQTKKTEEQGSEELMLAFTEASKKLYQLKNEYRLNRKLEKPHLLRQYRKDRARALTAINMKKEEIKQGS